MVGTPSYKRMHPGRSASALPSYGNGLGGGTRPPPTRKPYRPAPPTPAPRLKPSPQPGSAKWAKYARHAMKRGIPLPGPLGLALGVAPLLMSYWNSTASPPPVGDPEWQVEGNRVYFNGRREVHSANDGLFRRPDGYLYSRPVRGYYFNYPYPYEQEIYADYEKVDTIPQNPDAVRYHPSFIIPPGTTIDVPKGPVPDGPFIPPMPGASPDDPPLAVPAPYRKPEARPWDNPWDSPGRSRRPRRRHKYRPSYETAPGVSVEPPPIVGITVTPDGAVKVDTGKSTVTRPPRGTKETKVRNPMVRILAVAADVGSEIIELLDNWADMVGIDSEAPMQQKVEELFVDGKAWDVDPLDFAWMVMENHVSDQNWGKVFGAAQESMKDLGQSTYTSPTW